MHRPCLEAGLLVAPLVKQVVFVHVVHVDELAGVDDVAHNPGVQGQPHLTLLNTEHSLIVISDNTTAAALSCLACSHKTQLVLITRSG